MRHPITKGEALFSVVDKHTPGRNDNIIQMRAQWDAFDGFSTPQAYPGGRDAFFSSAHYPVAEAEALRALNAKIEDTMNVAERLRTVLELTPELRAEREASYGKSWRLWNRKLNCPSCNGDLRDLVDGPPFKLEIGMVENDRVARWRCPHCRHEWPRGE